MTDQPEAPDYETLSRDLRDSAGPLEMLVDFVQDGIELETWGQTPAGKLLLSRARRACRLSLEVLLQPSAKGDEIDRALFELRVQHRVLQSYADVVSIGRESERRLVNQDHQETET